MKDSASREQNNARIAPAEAQPVLERQFKDSGIAWIGEIPKDWEVCQFKRVHNGTNVGESIDKEYWSDDIKDIVFYTAGLNPINTTYKDFPTAKFTRINDILLSRNGTPYVYLPKENAAYTDHIIRVSIKKWYDRKFIMYAISQSISFEIVDTVSIATWSASLWNEQILPLPSLSEQRLIADFLDEKCGEIDELVALQEKMIEELKAYKQSVITETVTKGLNPNVKMKDSGVDWIGEIPESWSVVRAKYLLNERKERSEYGKEEPLSMSQKYGLIPTKDMDMVPNMASSFVGAKLVYKEDLVFNKLKAHLGVFATSSYEGLVSPDYAVYFNSGQCAIQYLEYLFKTPIYISEFIKLSTGVGAGLTRLYTSDLFTIPCLLPPYEEQQRIIDHIDDKCSEIDSLIAIKQKKIEELKDYKKSLIYEYVTGKKQVR